MAQAQYDYQGSPFTTASAPWTVGDNIQGNFTVAAPLDPLLVGADISGQLIDFSFSDGVQTRNLANSTICTFSVSTDTRGNLTRWTIALREAPTPPIGNDQLTIAINGPTILPSNFDQSDVGPSVGSACDSILPTAMAQSSAPGSWSSSALPPLDTTVYSFDGAPFVMADAPWTLGGAVTGTLTFSAPLPDLLPLTNVSLAWDDFSFSDGVQVRNPGNTEICKMQLATDGAGRIIHWIVSLREFPAPPLNDPQQTIDLTGPFGDNPLDVGGTAPSQGSGCATFVVTLGAKSAVPGTWNAPDPATLMPTRYDYSGNPFDPMSITPPWNAGDRVTGSFIVQVPLPPDLPLTNLSLALTAFSFLDGVQVRDSNNSTICNFEVATDADGNLADWKILLREAPFPPPDGQQSFMDLLGPGGGDLDSVGEGPAGGFPCDVIGPTSSAGVTPAGTWTAAPLTTESIPALTGIGLLLLAGLIGLAGALRLRRTT